MCELVHEHDRAEIFAWKHSVCHKTYGRIIRRQLARVIRNCSILGDVGCAFKVRRAFWRNLRAFLHSSVNQGFLILGLQKSVRKLVNYVNETRLAMSTLAIWCRVVQSRDVSLHNFDGLAMSGLAFSVAPCELVHEHDRVEIFAWKHDACHKTYGN